MSLNLATITDTWEQLGAEARDSGPDSPANGRFRGFCLALEMLDLLGTVKRLYRERRELAAELAKERR